MRQGRNWRTAAGAAVLATLVTVSPAVAATIGIIVDRTNRQAIVFDAETDNIIGAVPISLSSNSLASCSITPDQTRGYVAAGYPAVNEIDLSTSPPSHKKLIYNGFSAWRPQHTAITADGKYVVASFGSMVSVIDTFAGSASWPAFIDYADTVGVCTDNSVLLAIGGPNPEVRRYKLSPSGALVDTGETLAMAMRHVSCSPNARSAIGVEGNTARATSFQIPGLLVLDQRGLVRSLGISGLVNSSGDRVFLWSESAGSSPTSNVEEAAFDSGNGRFQQPLGQIVMMRPIEHGTHQLALHPRGDKVYVAQGSNPPYEAGVFVWKRAAGTQWSLVKILPAGLPTAVCLPACAAPVIQNASASPSTLWPPNHAMVPVTVDYQAGDGCPAACELSVSVNPPANGPGNGHTSQDWEVLSSRQVLLRAERAGNAGARTYTIAITCTNAAGQKSTRNLSVLVPHDQGK